MERQGVQAGVNMAGLIKDDCDFHYLTVGLYDNSITIDPRIAA